MRLCGRVYHWSEVRLAAEMLDECIALMTGEAPTEKADPNPLTKAGFDKWVNKYSAAVMKAVKTGDDRAVKAMVKALDKRWATLTARRRERLIVAAMRKLSLTSAQQTAVAKTIGDQMKFAILATKGASAKDLKGVQQVFDALDQRVLDHTVTSQAHFIRDAYGRRQVAMSEQARKIVAKGIDAGHDSATIGEALANRMSTAGVLRARAYWNTVSGIYMARSRSYGLARSYDDAGIKGALVEAVRDERTTEVCNFMHGKIIPNDRVLERYQDVADLEDPEDVRYLQPFMNLGKDKSGGEVLYYKNRDDKRVIVASVEQSARGVKDGSGKYSQKLSDADMVDAGIGMPPYHGGGCRTTTVPA